MSPTGAKALHSKATASTRSLQRGLEVFNLWAESLGRPLNASNELSTIFADLGLEELRHEIFSSDNDASTRKTFTLEICAGLKPLVSVLVLILRSCSKEVLTLS